MENNKYNKTYGFYFNGYNALIPTRDLNVLGLSYNPDENPTSINNIYMQKLNLSKNQAISYWFAFDDISGFTTSQQTIYSTSYRRVGNIANEFRIFKSANTNNIYSFYNYNNFINIKLIASAITSNTLYHIMYNQNNDDSSTFRQNTLYFNGKQVIDGIANNGLTNTNDQKNTVLPTEGRFSIFGAAFLNSTAYSTYQPVILPLVKIPSDYFYGYMFDFTNIRNFQPNTFKNSLNYSNFSKSIVDYLYNNGYGHNKNLNIVNQKLTSNDVNLPFIPQYNTIDFLNLKKYGSISSFANYIGPDALENGVSLSFQPVFNNSQTLTNTLINNMEKSFPYRIGNKLFPVKTNYPFLNTGLTSNEIFFSNKKISFYQDLLNSGGTYSYSGALTNNTYLYFNFSKLSSLNITNSKLRAFSIQNNRVPYDLTLPINTSMVLFNILGDSTTKLTGLTFNYSDDIYNLNRNSNYISKFNVINNVNMTGKTVNSSLGYISSNSNIFERGNMNRINTDDFAFTNNGYIHYNQSGRTDLNELNYIYNNIYYPNFVELCLPIYYSNTCSIASNRLRYRSPRYYPDINNQPNNFSSITSNMGHSNSVILKLVAPVATTMFTYGPQTQINNTYSAGTALIHSLYNTYIPSATTNYKNLVADFSNCGLTDYTLCSEYPLLYGFNNSGNNYYYTYIDSTLYNTNTVNNNSAITYTTLNLSNNSIWNDILFNNTVNQYGNLTDNNNRINYLLCNIGDRIQYGQINLNSNNLNGYFNTSTWTTIPDYSGGVPASRNYSFTLLNTPWTGRTNITRLDLSNNNINALGYYPQCVEFNITGNTSLSGDCGISIPSTMRTLRIGGTNSDGNIVTRATSVAYTLTSITQSGNFNNINTLNLNYCGLVNNGVSNTYSGGVFLLNGKNIIANSANTITLSNTVSVENSQQINCGQFSPFKFIDAANSSFSANSSSYTYGNIIDLSQSVIKSFNNIIAVGSGISRFIFPTGSSVNFNGIFDMSYNYILNDSANDLIEGKSGFTIPSNVTFTSGSSFIIQSNNRLYAYGSQSGSGVPNTPSGTTGINAKFNNMPIGTRILSNNINLRNNNFSSDTYNTIINNLYTNRLNFSTGGTRTLLIDRQYSDNSYTPTLPFSSYTTSLVFSAISKSLAQTYDLRNQTSGYNWNITDDYGTGATPYYRLVNSATTIGSVTDIIANFNINPAIYAEVSARTFTILDGGSQQLGTPLTPINNLSFSFVSRGTDIPATNNAVGSTYYRLRTNNSLILNLATQTITGFTFSIN